MKNNMEKNKNARSRAPNFTLEDDEHLLNVVSRHKAILENKKIDGAAIEEKNRTWALVAEEYNSTTRSYVRTVESLQQHYKNLKKKAKKMIAATEMCIPVNVEAFIESVDEYGENWEENSNADGASEDSYRSPYENLKYAAKKRINEGMKHVILTGGGPGRNSMYSVYDADSSAMASESQEEPIEVKHLEVVMGSCNNTDEEQITKNPLSPKIVLVTGQTPSESQTEVNPVPSTSKEEMHESFANNRTNLKRPFNQKFSVYRNINKYPRKESEGDKFKALAEDRMDLVKAQHELTSIKIKLAQEKLANVLLEREILNIKKLEQEEMLAHSRIIRSAELEKSKKE